MRKIISCLLAILLLTSCAVTAFASTTDNSSTVHYGIINSPEWSQMTRIERVAACQLPAEELHNLVTDELVQVVLDYPFFVDARAFNTNREGFLRVLAESTALQELLNREDNVDSLISRYATTDVETVAATLSEDNDFSELWKLEILLAQPKFSNLMDEQQVVKVFEIAEEKHEAKCSNPELYQGVTGVFYQSVNEHSGASTYAYNSYVQTPNGSDVLVYVWQSSDGDFSTTAKQELADEVAVAYPNATRLRHATIKYNCHSYAWYSTSASNIRWMPYPGAFITDGSYPELTKMTTSVGSRIVYYDTVDGSYGTPTHTAVIYSYKDYPKSRRTFVVESKWGSYGLYRHDSYDSPYSYDGPVPYDIKYFS